MGRVRASLLATLAGALVLAGCTGGRSTVEEPSPLPTVSTPAPLKQPGGKPAETKRPNIVFVLMDDFSMDLLPTMRSAAAMLRDGASYPHAFVTDSLCCVSRTSIFTGQYPHQTGVRINTPSSLDPSHPLGGYEAFQAYGNGERTFAGNLQRAGYTTGFVGKFLNRYEYTPGGDVPEPPPGWSDFNTLFGSAYDGWGFWRTYVEDGVVDVRRYRIPSVDASSEQKDRLYAGSVTQRVALDFIQEHRSDHRPWFLEVAPYAPHSRVGPEGAFQGDPGFPPAFRDRPSPDHPGGNCGRVQCEDLGVEDLPGYGDDFADNAPSYADGTPAPAVWDPLEITPEKATLTLRDRARMVQSIDRMVQHILREVPPNTYVVLTSDNGFHLGQFGLGMGKGSAYDADIRVPLLVVGPGVRPGERPEVVSNIDLASTFEDLAGIRSPRYRSGLSLVPTFDDPTLDRQHYAFVEHTWSGSGDDPDASDGALGLVPSYVAVRSRDAVLIRTDLDRDPDVVEYVWEFYEYGDADFERANTYAHPGDPGELRRLTRKLEQFDQCSVAVHDAAVPRECRDLTQ
jgi:N-acetylglucosamine-6-sulfatase